MKSLNSYSNEKFSYMNSINSSINEKPIYTFESLIVNHGADIDSVFHKMNLHNINYVTIIFPENYETTVMTSKVKVSEILSENHIIILPDEIVDPPTDSVIDITKTITISKVTDEKKIFEVLEKKSDDEINKLAHFLWLFNVDEPENYFNEEFTDEKLNSYINEYLNCFHIYLQHFVPFYLCIFKL